MFNETHIPMAYRFINKAKEMLCVTSIPDLVDYSIRSYKFVSDSEKLTLQIDEKTKLTIEIEVSK